jgi:hypothetical protein
MPKLYDEIILNCNILDAYNKLQKLELEKKLNPQALLTINFENERLIKYQLKHGEHIAAFEKIFFPENFTVLTQRYSKELFNYLFFFYSFHEQGNKTLLKYIQDFELDEDNKAKEKEMSDFLSTNGNLIRQILSK